jgi:hypothetical protein
MAAECKTEQEIFAGGEDSCGAERVDSEGGKARSRAKTGLCGVVLDATHCTAGSYPGKADTLKR